MKTAKSIHIVFKNTKGLGKAGFTLGITEGQFEQAARWQSFRGEYDHAFFKSKEEFANSIVRYLNNPNAEVVKAECTYVVYEKNKHTDGQWKTMDLSAVLPVGSARINNVLSILWIIIFCRIIGIFLTL